MWSSPLVPLQHFFLSEPVAFRRVYGLESYSRTSGESNHHRQSVSDTRVPRYQLHHEDDSRVTRLKRESEQTLPELEKEIVDEVERSKPRI